MRAIAKFFIRHPGLDRFLPNWLWDIIHAKAINHIDSLLNSKALNSEEEMMKNILKDLEGK